MSSKFAVVLVEGVSGVELSLGLEAEDEADAVEHWSAMFPAARKRRRESSAVVEVLLVAVLRAGRV